MNDFAQNIVLIGMPGSGKSAVGRMAAQGCDMGFIDSDSEIEREQGMTIREIFERVGEDGFRKIETGVLSRLADSVETENSALQHANGFILATGGGVVERPENKDLLMRIGYVVYIMRDPDDIAENVDYDQDRPLLTSVDALYELWERREPLYQDWAQRILTAVDTAELTAEILSNMIIATREI